MDKNQTNHDKEILSENLPAEDLIDKTITTEEAYLPKHSSENTPADESLDATKKRTRLIFIIFSCILLVAILGFIFWQLYVANIDRIVIEQNDPGLSDYSATDEIQESLSRFEKQS
jgi:hypothetical protein